MSIMDDLKTYARTQFPEEALMYFEERMRGEPSEEVLAERLLNHPMVTLRDLMLQYNRLHRRFLSVILKTTPCQKAVDTALFCACLCLLAAHDLKNFQELGGPMPIKQRLKVMKRTLERRRKEERARAREERREADAKL